MSAPETVSIQYRTAESLPPVIRRQWDVDWDDLFARLVSDEKLFMPVPENLTLQALRLSVRAAALRRGLNVSCRAVGRELLLSIKRTPPRSSFSQRNQEILAALDAGEKMESIAHRYSLTRQRIEQIKVGDFRNLPFGKGRTEASLEFLEPYFAHIEQNFCPCCGAEIISGLWLCAECKALQKVIRDIKASLRTYKNGTEQGRRQAVYLIRKYHIKPEHLAGRKAVTA